MSADAGKRAAGRAAAALVSDGMRLGLGTGSTVTHFLDALAERDLEVGGIPTSEATAARCRDHDITLLDPADVERIDLAVDGADELDEHLTLTKGGGGALLREKVVASLADRFVVIATPDKVVDRLGASFALPVEVVDFAGSTVARALAGRGFEVVERRDETGEPVRTDNGNLLLDAMMPGGIEDPAVTDVAITLMPGVVACGLFVGLASDALLGHPDGTVEHRRAVAEAASAPSHPPS